MGIEGDHHDFGVFTLTPGTLEGVVDKGLVATVHPVEHPEDDHTHG